jgi:CheY-like chemotaxis protein
MYGGAVMQSAVVLLVEDDRGDQELTRRAFLEGSIKPDIHIVDDGEIALNYLFRQGNFSDAERYPLPDIILLDLNLPRVSGREVLRQIKSDHKLCHIPLIVLTTSQIDRDVLNSYNGGANCYLVKPASVDAFREMVRTIEKFWLGMSRLPSLKAAWQAPLH